MAISDEVIRKNRQYLTQAQIDALVAAEKRFNNQNAGNRAGALATAREQYDTGYRGLQNMGLAGASGATPTSGEVPRLQQQIRTPFEDYNNRLRDVERQRLGVLGANFAAQTQAQRAAEAERRRQEEAYQRAVAAAQSMLSNIKTSITPSYVGPTLTDAEKAARKAQADGLKRTQQLQQQTVNAAIKAQVDGMNRTARPQDVAAAAAFNIAHYSQQPAVTAANMAQDRGAKLTEQLKGSTDTSTANRYYVDANQKAFTKEQAEAEYKEAQNRFANLTQARHVGANVTEEEYKVAKYQRDTAKLKAENPKLYQSFAIIENPYADAKSREEAGNEIMRAYGYTNDERTAEQYAADKKKAAQYSSYLATFDDKNASAEEKKAAENMLKNMGVTPDQAREFISKHRQARAGQGEYAYYKNAIINSLTYAGKAPSKHINKDETDPLYRAVNKLPDITEKENNYLMEGLPQADVTTSEEYVGNELRYLSEDERNAYNYIYETEGLQKANEYIREGLPLRNIRAATEDEAYAQQLVDNAPVAANLLSIASGTFGNVPAMIEKLVKGTYNFVAQPQTPLFIDTSDDRLANMSNMIQSATSQKILESNPGTSGKIYNFAYQTGMSMAQSAVAMTFAAAGAPWAVDVMFFSSAGNEAYKDAIERGATQEQALAYGVLSGTAEALFEHASIEHFMNLDYQGKGRLIKNMLSQAGAEASEEVNTELADILADAWTMRDKSQYNLAVQEYTNKYIDQYMSEGFSEDEAKERATEEAKNHAFMDQLKNVGMAGLGGLASGLGFGVFGALPNAVSQVKTGKEAKTAKVVDQYVQNGALLGGDAAKLAQEVNDAYGVKKTKSGSIETEKVAGREKMQTTEPSNRLVGALVQQVNKQVQELAQSAESGAAVQSLLTGEKLTTNGAKAVMDQLGADTVKEMGYDTSSPSAFAKSFNARLQENSITPRMQESKYRQAAYGMAERRNSPIEYQEKYRAFTAEDRANAAVTAARANATNRVWANPTQGMAMATPEGNRVMPMPGNLRAVEQAEQERAGFKTRATATKGNVTYAVAGMEAREGLSNEQTYSEIQKGLTKEARQKAQLYEKLASALGVKMIIHDVMTGTNGFIDEKGNMHVVLSGKQSVLRVAAHELTHLMKENAGNEYASMRDHLISEVGQDKFDRMTKQKANEYGIDLSTEKGKILADDEVCAELCERMLSNEDALEKFAEKDTAAAKTLKEHLLKILNAIKAAFKRAENRDFGESWSDLIKSQDTIESWITGLQKAIDNAGKKTTEKTDTMRGVLFLSEEDEARAERKKQAEANAEKGTYVRGISAKEMDSVLSNVMVGDKSNYEGNDYEHSRAMIAQLVPEVIDALNGEANLDDVQEKLETAVGEMVDNYFEEYGDGLPNLRSKIDATIGIGDQAKGEIKYSEKNMRKVANEISHALGKRVTLVGETNPKFKTAQKLDSLWDAMNEDEVIDQKYNWSTDVNKLVDFINDQSADRVKLTGKERENTIYAQVGEMISAVSDMLSEKTGKRYSLDTGSKRAQREYEQKTDAIYNELTQARQDLSNAERKRNSILESKEYNEAVETVSNAKGDDLDAAIRQYVDFMNKSGANEAQRTIDALQKKVQQLKDQFDKLTGEKAASDREKAIEKSGLSEQDYDRKQAAKEFGYTPHFYDAGYMLPDGKMLNFSGGKGKHFGTRGQDHRAIGTIYDDSQGSEAMTRFMNGGNIRVMGETPGIDISNVMEPTREQYSKIRQFASESAGKRFFNVDISDENGNSVGALSYDGRVSPDRVVNDIKHYFSTGEIRQQSDVSRFLYSLDTDAIRQAFTVIDTAGIEDGLEALKDVKHVGSFALKDITRFLDASAGKNKDLRNTLHAIFEAPHSEATGRYAQGVERMQQKVLDIGKRAGVCDEKGKHFDSKKSAAIQNIGEGFSNTYTDLKLKVKDADHVTVKAYEPGTDNLVDSEKDYTLKELRQAYGTNAADYVWSRVFDETQKAQETGGKPGWVDEKVNTRPYTIDDLQTAYPNDWQKLKAAADEFRQMYDEYIRDQNNMLATIYPIESEYADVEKLDAGIEKKQERLAQHKAAVNTQIENLQKSLEAKEKEIASKKRTDTKAYRQLVEQANKLTSKIAEVKAEIAEYEANVKDELVKMNTLKAEMQNAVQKGDYSLKRIHRLQYRPDYFHHFTEMASGIQNLKSIFTNNTDIAPAIVGKSEGTKAKTRWAGYFQQRMGGDYTADALNGMLRYGQLAEYKLAFDPLTAYLRDVNKQIRNMSSDTNRDGLIRYIDQWADNIAGKSHKLDRVVSDSGMAPRKAMQVLQWINSRVIQNTLLFNMRSALVQISNITNAKGIVKNNIDWVNGLKAWALAAKGDEAMASIMAQSNFLASRYMDGIALTDSKLKSAKQFAGWMLGALDEVSAKATWWAAYQQYTRNPNAAKNQYRNYEDAIDYADDITRRTHAGRGVGELAPAMTSRVINFVAPFQVEVNNTWQLLKDNVKQKNYLGLLSTGLSVFLFNTFFEAIVGSTPLGFDFIRAVVDIALGFLNDDPDDDPDAKEIGQRFAGELVGGLPFASQLVAAFGEDNAKKLLGENNDATRYGNTQIGVSAVVNAAKGLKDIGTGLIEGRRVNWLDDLDDLMNLTLPMGAKQLTRTAQGLATVAKGYAGKYDNAGDEKVQFVTDQDVLHYIHAGLFGKWALTEASEYFGEKRLLPELFGKYNGPKSSTGSMVDAKEYKAALKTGIDGKQYFTLKYDLKKYTTQAGKRAEMAEQPFTAEQKAQLDALMIVDSKKESRTNGAVVYQKNNDGEWDVKADYSSSEWLEVAELGTKQYDLAKESGVKPAQYMQIYSVWKSLSGNDKKDQARAYLKSLHLTKEQYDYIWTNVFKYKAE